MNTRFANANVKQNTLQGQCKSRKWYFLFSITFDGEMTNFLSQGKFCLEKRQKQK